MKTSSRKNRSKLKNPHKVGPKSIPKLIFVLIFALVGGYLFLHYTSASEVNTTLEGVKLDSVTVKDGSGRVITAIKDGDPSVGETSSGMIGMADQGEHESMMHDDPASGAVTDINSLAATSASSVYELCTGFSEPRIPLEAHAWWFPTVVSPSTTAQSGRSLGHAHTITCLPYKQTVTSENLPLKVNMMAHLANVPTNQRNIIIRVHEIQIRGRNGDTPDILVDSFKKGSAASNDAWMVCDFSLGNDCSTTVPVNVDLVLSDRIPKTHDRNKGFTTNGRKQIRVMSVHEVYDKATGRLIGKMRAIARAPFTLSTPTLSGSENYTRDGGQQLEASGWFIGNDIVNKQGTGGYVTPNLLSPLPTSAQPRTGSMTLNFKFDADPCEDCKTFQVPIRYVSMHLDPSFPDNTGKILYKETFIPGTITATRGVTLRWSDLSPGLHKFVVKLKQPMIDPATPAELQATNQGSLHIPFVVQ